MTLTKREREELRLRFGGKCSYCGVVLVNGWHADHLEPVEREWWKQQKWWKEAHGFQYRFDEHSGKLTREAVPTEPAKLGHPERDTLANMMPSCRACNIDKHATSLELWRKQLEDRVGVCRRNYSAFRHAERFGLVMEIKKPVVFWFETYMEQLKATSATDPEKEETHEAME